MSVIGIIYVLLNFELGLFVKTLKRMMKPDSPRKLRIELYIFNGAQKLYEEKIVIDNTLISYEYFLSYYNGYISQQSQGRYRSVRASMSLL